MPRVQYTKQAKLNVMILNLDTNVTAERTEKTRRSKAFAFITGLHHLKNDKK